jgi:hypothetical protein
MMMSQVVRRTSTTVVDNSFLEALIRLLKVTFHGQVTLITQNFRVVQVERKENFNPEELLEDHLGLSADNFSPQTVKDKVVQALKGLEFGQVVLLIKKGRLVQIERHLKERFSDLQGLSGDGI